MKKHSLKAVILTGTIVFILIMGILSSVFNYVNYRRAFYDDYKAYIHEILDLTLARIDNDDLRECTDTLKESDKFYELRDYMDSLMNGMEIHALYVLRPQVVDGKYNIMSIISGETTEDRINEPEECLWLGWTSTDEYEEATVRQLFDIMSGDDYVFFEDPTEWGYDYTGAKTLRDSSGEAYGILCCDIEMSSILDTIMRSAIQNSAIVFALGIIFVICFILWADHYIMSPILKLQTAVSDYSARCSGQRNKRELKYDDPEIHTHNEVETLADAVRTMTESISEYVDAIADAEKKVDDMQYMANKDGLTNVRNKKGYEEYVTRLERDMAREEMVFGIAMIDLNFLKKINDTYGHEYGDRAIIKLCEHICLTFSHCPVFRIGGDEFVVVIKGRDHARKDELMAQFKAKLDEYGSDESLQPWDRISAAIGYAEYDMNIDPDVMSIFRRADKAMYDNKKEMKAVREE